MKKYTNPLFFRPNRVWRCYLGGKLLDKMMFEEHETDGLFPENWLGSSTKANNKDRGGSENEGISTLTSGDLLSDLLLKDGDIILGEKNRGINVLCKFLDSAIRLPFQCHPDREFAKKYCRSDYGKTESWFILDTREIGGQKPYVMLGFKPGINRKAFKKAVLEQDIPSVMSMMHKIEVKPGDNFFIPGRIPHAIGPGILMLEVQEPTDLVVQPEKKIGDVTLSDYNMWQNLTPDQGLECFEYRGREKEEVLRELMIRPVSKNGPVEVLVDSNRTDCFRVSAIKLRPGEEFNYAVPSKWQLAVVTHGGGSVTAESRFDIRHGDCFLIPNPVRSLKFSSSSSEGLTVYMIQ